MGAAAGPPARPASGPAAAGGAVTAGAAAGIVCRRSLRSAIRSVMSFSAAEIASSCTRRSWTSRRMVALWSASDSLSRLISRSVSSDARWRSASWPCSDEIWISRRSMSLFTAKTGTGAAIAQARTAHRTGMTRRTGGPPRSDDTTFKPLDLERVLLAADYEVGAAVPGEGLLGGAGVERALLAVRDRLQPVARHPEAHQVVPGGAGPLVSEGQVVVDGAALVGVSLDHDP